MGKKLIILLSIFLLLFSACSIENEIKTNDNNQIVQKELICNQPYIRNGYDCCLDENSNNICDNDEKTDLVTFNDTNSINKENNSFLNDSLLTTDLTNKNQDKIKILRDNVSILDYPKNFDVIRLTNNWNPEFSQFIDNNNNVFYLTIELNNNLEEEKNLYVYNINQNTSIKLMSDVEFDSIQGFTYGSRTIILPKFKDYYSENKNLNIIFEYVNSSLIELFNFRTIDLSESNFEKKYLSCFGLYENKLICLEPKLIVFDCEEIAEKRYCDKNIKKDQLINRVVIFDIDKKEKFYPLNLSKNISTDLKDFQNIRHLKIKGNLFYACSELPHFFNYQSRLGGAYDTSYVPIPETLRDFHDKKLSVYSSFCGVYNLDNNTLNRVSNYEDYFKMSVSVLPNDKDYFRERLDFSHYMASCSHYRYKLFDILKNKTALILEFDQKEVHDSYYLSKGMSPTCVHYPLGTNPHILNLFNGEYLIIIDDRNKNEFNIISDHRYTDIYAIKINYSDNFSFNNTYSIIEPDNFSEIEINYNLKDNNKDSFNSKLFEVIKIIDGDTIKIVYDGEEQNVRLIGVNTPEIKNPIECFGNEAKEELKKLISNNKISLEFDETQNEYDFYNRLLAYVILDDGTNLNKYLIENGFGLEYTYESKYKYQSDFKNAQEYAQENNFGLWSEDTCNGNLSLS